MSAIGMRGLSSFSERVGWICHKCHGSGQRRKPKPPQLPPMRAMIAMITGPVTYEPIEFTVVVCPYCDGRGRP